MTEAEGPEAAMGLTGVAAVDRYRWDLSVDGEIVFDYDARKRQFIGVGARSAG
jgi:hypothetical protein